MESSGETAIVLKKEESSGPTIIETSRSATLPGTYEKYKIEAVPVRTDGSRSERVLKLVIKDTADGENGAENYYRNWKLLRDNGIPTISSMRLVDENTVVMGDMTHDGGQFFGKEKSGDLIWKDTGKRDLTHIEKEFLEINPDEVIKSLQELQELAWSKGILLPPDDPYDLLVHPDGSWQVLVIDLTQVDFKKNEGDDYKKSMLDKMVNMYTSIRERLLDKADR